MLNFIFKAHKRTYPFGIEGGAQYLKEFLEVKQSHKEELKSVRDFIRSSYDELSCSLLPDPGKRLFKIYLL